MTQPANTFDSYDAVGNREDLADLIIDISPMETPFMSRIAKRGKADAVLHEWQVDELAAAAANNVIEGDDATLDASTPTKRLSNRCQISDKTVVISGTQEAVMKAGRKSELAYQLAKKGKELKRDMELMLTGNRGIVVGDNTTARSAGSLEAWMHTNALRGGGAGDDAAFTSEQLDAGANPTANIATDGDTRALTEGLLKQVIRSIWTQGGDGEIIMVGPFQKQALSGMTRSATGITADSTYRITQDAADRRVTNAVDVYESDFGTHRVVPNRFQRDRTLFVLTADLWSVDYLRSFRQYPLAKTGDSEKRQLLAEYTLSALNEKGSGCIADLTTS